ncbi:hypothetical protein VTL71DRAFT_8395 [Oculimacula yallundae]|uniref:Uncharacterized protein n=1 Tax=Oculimacula yallundae TaxID=86028 RepID=A0ABR4CXP2_9HELO
MATATIDGSNNGDISNGRVGGERFQQSDGMMEEHDSRAAHGMPTYPQVDREDISSGSKHGGSQVVAKSSEKTTVLGREGCEIWFPPTQIKKMLGDHLQTATRPCKIFYHDALKDAPNPGLFVRVSGPVAFPFLERDIECIIEASQRSELETETEETPSAKTTWEVPFDMIELRNPSWSHLITTVVSRISSEFEIDQTGRGILATKPLLILYGPDSIAKPLNCQNSEPPVFGFLDITLPSKYAGGELHVEHDGRKEQIPVIQNSEYDCSCLAWFSNVACTSAPSSEGHRLVLRYTLEHKSPGPICCATPLAEEVIKLQSILTSWIKQKDQITHKILSYVLSNKYEDGQLDHIKFSDSDQLAVTQLIEACAEVGLFLCLSTLIARIAPQKDVASSSEATERGNCPSNSCQLGRIVGLDGKELLEDYRMDFKEDDIVQDRPFEGDDYVLDEESETENNSVVKIFRKSVVIMMPLEARIPFLYGVSAPDYNERVKELLAHFCSLSKSSVEFATSENEIRQVCDAVLSTISWDPARVFSFASGYTKDVQSFVLKAIQLLGDKCLLSRAFPIGFADFDNFQMLESASKSFGPNWLRCSLSQQLAEMTDFLNRFAVIGRIETLISDNSWVNMQYESAIKALRFASHEDIEGAIKAASFWESDSRLETILIPSIKKELLGNYMVLTLLSQLSVEKQIPRSVFEALAPISIEHFTLGTHWSCFYQPMANILLHCHNLGLSVPFQQAITQISCAALKASLDELENEYLKFLGKLAATIDRTTCMALPIVQGLFQHVINLIALKCAPVKDTWVLSPAGCGCSDCNELDAFLNNHLVDGARFRRKAEQRNHLELRLQMHHPTRVKTMTVVAPELPYILRVIKIAGPTDNPIQYWLKKYEALSTSINWLGSKRLRHLLGPHYSNLMALKPIYFTPIISDTVSQVVDLTAENHISSANTPPPLPPNVLGSHNRSQFDPASRVALSHPVTSQNMSSATAFLPINPLFPSQLLTTSTRSTAEGVRNNQASGHVITNNQRIGSPATVVQSIARPNVSRHDVLQRAAAHTTAPTVAPSRRIVVKTENLAPPSHQSIDIQRPGETRTPITPVSISTNSPRDSPLRQLGAQQNGNSALPKRKDPPPSAERSSSKDSPLEANKRVRVEEPISIPGGVWGSIDAPPPPLPDNHTPPPPPAWVVSALANLEPRFPGHRFKCIMRHHPVSPNSKVPYANPDFGYPLPANVTYMWIPRIQCEDCPEKLYIPGSGKSVSNFVIHLKSRMHASNVETRLQRRI